MLKVTRGFNYGPDDTRVEAGALIADDALPADVAQELYAKGVLVTIPAEEEPQDEAEPPARKRTAKRTNQDTPDDGAAVTEAQSGGDE